MNDDFQYDVDLDYDSSRNCSERGCDDEGICRCGRIENARIEGVHSWEIARKFATLDIIHNHAIERVISRFDTDDFDIEVCGGYYGDEIDSVKLASSSIDALHKLQGMLTTSEWIEYYLGLENGEVLPQHRNRSWEHAQVPIDDIVSGRNRADLDKKRIGFYRPYISNDSFQPILLCEKKGRDNYKLVDGYHRYHVAIEEKVKKVDVIYYIGNKKKVADFELGSAL
jgi:hypothetical protein